MLTNLQNGEPVSVQTDWVVLAMGVRPRHELAEQFKKAFQNVRIIEDAAKGGRILEATQDAHGQAYVFQSE